MYLGLLPAEYIYPYLNTPETIQAAHPPRVQGSQHRMPKRKKEGTIAPHFPSAVRPLDRDRRAWNPTGEPTHRTKKGESVPPQRPKSPLR